MSNSRRILNRKRRMRHELVVEKSDLEIFKKIADVLNRL